MWVFGLEELAVLSCWTLRWCCIFHPISLVLPKETGWSPKEKRLWGGGAPVRFRDPPASPTRVGGATRPLRCPLRGRIESLAPRARGFGLDVDWRLKVFCPAFLQKSGRGPGAEPGPRAAARGIPPCSQSAGGGQRGNPRRGFPLCGRPKPPAASRTSITPVVNERRAGVESRPNSDKRHCPFNTKNAAHWAAFSTLYSSPCLGCLGLPP